MGKSLFKTVFASMLFAIIILGGYSCSSGDNMDEFEVRRMIEEALKENNKQIPVKGWEVANFEVDGWSWDDNSKRYEAVYDLPELTEEIYEKGAVLGYIFIGEQDENEVLIMLPYVRTYDDTDPPVTEKISFDVQYVKEGKVAPTVAFYIQTSDLFGGVEFEGSIPTHYFRLILVW